MTREYGEANIRRLIRRGAKAIGCPSCGKPPTMSYSTAMKRPYRYHIECRECECWSWAGNATLALARWNRKEYAA